MIPASCSFASSTELFLVPSFDAGATTADKFVDEEVGEEELLVGAVVDGACEDEFLNLKLKLETELDLAVISLSRGATAVA